MALEKEINIKVQATGTEKSIAQVDKLKSKLHQLDSATGEVAKGMKASGSAILENGGAMGLLNDATGGVAMQIKDAVEATALFTKGTTIASLAQKAYTFVIGTTTGALKALRLALAATGIGLIVVALGFLIEKLMSTTDATEEQTKAQEKLNQELEDTKKLTDDVIKSLDYYTSISLANAKKRGASEAELKKIEIDGINAKLKANTNEINLIKASQDKEYNLSKEQLKRIQDLREQNEALVRQGTLSVVEFEAEQADKKREQEKAISEKRAEDLKADREKQLQAQKEFQEQLAKELLEFQAIQVRAELDLAFEKRAEDAENTLENNKNLNSAIAQLDADDAKRKEDLALAEKNREETIANTRLGVRTNVENLLGALSKKGSALAKGLAVANVVREQVQSASASISALTIANAKAVAVSPTTAGQPFVGINTASTIAGIAASAIGAGKAIKDILSESKSAGGGGSANISSSGGSTPSAPSFNLVAGTGTNQIAQGLASGQSQPIQAYVVSGAVTTGQALDRNIINDASI